MPTLLRNRYAHYDYQIEEEYEAGIKLLGHEVKSLKEGKGTLAGTYVKVDQSGLSLVGLNIPLYSKAGITLPYYDPQRTRRLLLNKTEIKSITGRVERSGYTVIPLKMYTKGTLLKLSIGLGRGKKKAQKKADLIAKERDRQAERELKESGFNK